MTAVRVELLADRADLIRRAAEIRVTDWGPGEGTPLEWWIDVTTKEAGRNQLPCSWVAIDGDREAVGVVGIGEFDLEELRDERTPWVLGMIVAPERRGQGIGRQLVRALVTWASDQGFQEVWVATERARAFYERCGWRHSETITKRDGQRADILRRSAAVAVEPAS